MIFFYWDKGWLFTTNTRKFKHIWIRNWQIGPLGFVVANHITAKVMIHMVNYLDYTNKGDTAEADIILRVCRATLEDGPM